MSRRTDRVAPWGRLTDDPHRVITLSDRRRLAATIRATRGQGLASGMHRSYGDVSTNAQGTLWDARPLDRFVSFDPESGLLTCEPGVLLRDIQAVFSERGWMLAVTPGTALVTVAGAIANDVHGKNHHGSGTFGDHVAALTLLRTDGQVVECSRDENADWLEATIGGLGLTGVIVQATIRLAAVPGPWVHAEDLVFESLSEFAALADESVTTFEHTVAWIDVTTDGGRRGILTRGNAIPVPGKAVQEQRAIRFPVTPPLSIVNGVTLPTFNRAYFRVKALRARPRVEHYRSFFYPLDAVRDWNRLYGPMGFYQYQSVVPRHEAEETTREMLAETAKAGLGSFLGVLKTFGDVPSAGMLSFPREGTTLAMDFPAGRPRTEALFGRLDAIVRSAGGRLYPAKDARMPVDMFESGYPRLNEFLAYRDPGISSDLARRLFGD